MRSFSLLRDVCRTLVLMAVIPMLTCCGFEDNSPAWEVGDTVDEFVKVTQYSDSKVFQDDLDALVTYSLDARAVRWAYYALVSKGGGKNAPFSSTMDDLDNNQACKKATQDLYNYIDGIVDRADEYEEMLSNLEATGILSTPTTRGILSDIFDFVTGCKKAGTVSRKSTVTTMRELGWTSNPAKLKELYNTIPSELRRGYTDHVAFWRDFSAGKLDNRASQIYVNLYNYADQDFGEKARDLDITPGKNITVVGAELIEKGAAIVIDASPMSTQLGYGKDLYGAITATEKLVKEGDVKGFLQNAANNLVNYGRDAAKLADKMRGLDIIYWENGDTFWDYVGKDMATIWYNDVCFSEEYKNILDNGEGERLVPNLVKTKDANGEEITLVVLLDEGTGHVSISYVLDKDGNVITNPQIPGQKKITVVNRHTGKRTTKPVTVKPDGDTDVEVDLAYDETLLEEEPENGDLQLKPSSINDKTGEGGYHRIAIITNYLYYTCKTESDWIKCEIPSDVNFMYVKVTDNQTKKERSGKITVAATNSKGKVLKTVVLPITQQPYIEPEITITADPSSLTFTGAEDTKVVWASIPSGIKSWGAEAENDLIGWADVEPYLDEETYPAVKVSVAENTTGEERSGTFYIWASNDEKGKKLDYKTTVVVKQLPQGPSGNFKFYNAMIEVYATTVDDRDQRQYDIYTNGGVWTPEKSGKTDEKFTVTETSDGYHIYAERDRVKEGKRANEKIILSFDVHIKDGQLGEVTDIRFLNVWPDVLNSTMVKVDTASVKRLPFVTTEHKNAYIYSGFSCELATWEASEENGTLKDWYFNRNESFINPTSSHNYVLKKSSKNKVTVKLVYRLE